MLTLNIITFVHLVIFFCLLFFRKNNTVPNKVLALILINPGINFISNVNILLGNLSTFPELYFFAQITCFYFGPLVLAYCYLLTGKRILFLNPFFILTGLASLLSIYFYIEFKLMLPQDQHHYLDGILNEPYPEQMNIINGLFMLLQLIYFSLSAIHIYKFNKKQKDFFSSETTTQIKFLKRFISLIWSLNFITIFAYFFLETVTVEYILLPLVLVFIYSFVLYYAFKHNSIFTVSSYKVFQYNHEALNTPLETPKPTTEKNNIESLLQHAITVDKFHTKIGCTLTDLAKLIDLPAYKISQHIKRHHQKNFSQFINDFRVSYAKKLLKEKTNWTVEAIAFEAGFNSRASFYRVFKESVGESPTNFLKH